MDRYYSPKFCYHWRLFLVHLNLFHIREQQIYSSKISLDIEFTFLVGSCKWKKSTIFLFFIAPPPPEYYSKIRSGVSVSPLVCEPNRTTDFAQTSSQCRCHCTSTYPRNSFWLLHHLLRVTATTSAASYQKSNARLTRKLQATEPCLLSATYSCS